MKKAFLTIIFLLTLIITLSTCILIYLNYKYEKAIGELKYGNIEKAISMLRNIKYFYPESRKMLFEIYIDKRFYINSPETAYMYLDSFSNIEKEKIIKLTLEYNQLYPHSKKFLENELKTLN